MNGVFDFGLPEHYLSSAKIARRLVDQDWRTRADVYDVPGAPGVTVAVPDANDIAIAKLCAWRDKDREWLKEAIALGLIDLKKVEDRIDPILEGPDTPALAERIRRIEILRP